MKKISSLLFLLGLVLVYIGTYAYYSKDIEGTVIFNTGKFAFDIKYKGSILTSIDLNDTVTDQAVAGKINPGDKGNFTFDVVATGSDVDVDYNVVFTGTNVPTNMEFYIDDTKVDLKNYTLSGILNYDASSMTKSYTVYWVWPYFGESTDDIDFVNKDIILNISANGNQRPNR